MLAAPTPGAIKNEQVPTLPLEVEEEQEDIEAPVITHKEVTSGTAFTPVKIEASVTDNIAVNAVTLYYKTMEEETFRSVVMNRDGNNEGTYSGEIPAADVQSSISYYIEASDGKNVSKTEEYLIDIAKEEVDFQSLPPFLVTEVVPDSTNVDQRMAMNLLKSTITPTRTLILRITRYSTVMELKVLRMLFGPPFQMM